MGLFEHPQHSQSLSGFYLCNDDDDDENSDNNDDIMMLNMMTVPSMIETHELVVPRSIPMMSPASDANPRLPVSDINDDSGSLFMLPMLLLHAIWLAI